MATRAYIEVTPSMVKMVLKHFYNNNDNRTTTISKKFKIKQHLVDYILDIHLKYKKNAYVV